jgi:hypothetical protein
MLTLKEINSWEELVSFLQGLPEVDLACRGQEKRYDLMKSKIDRCLDALKLEDRLRIERAVCQRFREHAPIHLSAVERRYLQTRWIQLVVMQHYGAPTRLLDWSKSAWVAAYFAVFGAWDCDGYVYIFPRYLFEHRIESSIRSQLGSDFVFGPHRSDLNFSDQKWDLAEANDVLFRPEKVVKLSEWVATYYCREAHFPRLVAQQGFFTFGSTPGVDHWKQICSVLGDNNCECFEVTIKCNVKPKILRMLNNVGLNGATLFPGADGIGRSLEGYVRAWPLVPRPGHF